MLAEEVLQESESEDLVSALTGRTQIYVLSVSQTGNVATVDLGGDVDLMQEYDVFCLKVDFDTKLGAFVRMKCLPVFDGLIQKLAFRSQRTALHVFNRFIITGD